MGGGRGTGGQVRYLGLVDRLEGGLVRWETVRNWAGGRTGEWLECV